MDVRVGLWRKLSTKELMLLNCGVEKTLESPLDCKETQPVHPKGDQSWVFLGRNDAKTETPVLWPPHAKSWLIGKDSDAGRDCGQEEKGTTEDEMAGWHHWLDGHEFEWTLGVGDGQGGLRSDQLLSRVRLFVTQWIAAHQASLSITNSRSSLRLNLASCNSLGGKESNMTERLKWTELNWTELGSHYWRWVECRPSLACSSGAITV